MEDAADGSSGQGLIVGEAELTRADLAQALARLPGSPRPWILPAVFGAIALVFLIMSPSALSAPSVLTVLLPLAFVGIMLVWLQRSTRNAWVKQALDNVGGRTTFRFDDYGFSSESSTRQHRLAWAALARALETPEAFLVYTTPRTLLVVPKRAFTAAEVSALGRMLPERVKQNPVAAGRFSAGRVLLLWAVLIVTFLAIWHFLNQDAGSEGHRHGRHQDAKSDTEKR